MTKPTERERLDRARFGWFNWYLTRKRIDTNNERQWCRRVSWRRVL